MDMQTGSVVSILESSAPSVAWSVKKHAAPCAHNGDIGIVNDKGALVAVAYANSHAYQRANLIASAPELLALALEVTENAILSGMEIGEKARAVILKATGGAA
jgi:hypothetical protein